MKEVFRDIPGYPGFCVTKNGIVKDKSKNELITPYVNRTGYHCFSTNKFCKTYNLSVHRAVALAWIKNPDSHLKTMVNHKDGNKGNNKRSNLEWVTVGENNVHAVRMNLRGDNVPALVRDFETGKVHEFASVAQAAEFMGYHKNTTAKSMYLKKFGALLKGRYEFKFKCGPSEWFYETRTEKIRPSWYRVTVYDGTNKTEYYTAKQLLKAFQVYDSKERGVPALAKFIAERYKHLKVVLEDHYMRKPPEHNGRYRHCAKLGITARKGSREIVFDSLTKAAKHFRVDRSNIKHKARTGETLLGWNFAINSCPPS